MAFGDLTRIEATVSLDVYNYDPGEDAQALTAALRDAVEKLGIHHAAFEVDVEALDPAGFSVRVPS